MRLTPLPFPDTVHSITVSLDAALMINIGGIEKELRSRKCYLLFVICNSHTYCLASWYGSSLCIQTETRVNLCSLLQSWVWWWTRIIRKGRTGSIYHPWLYSCHPYESRFAYFPPGCYGLAEGSAWYSELCFDYARGMIM